MTVMSGNANSTMDHFCGSTFWNSSLTWDTDNPDFTPCFQKTVLVWIPCVFLWLATVIEIYQMVRSKEADIPWNKLNISKLIATLLLILLQLMNCSIYIYIASRNQNSVFIADYHDSLIKLLTFVLSAALLLSNRKYGIRTSGVLFIFWLLLILAELPQLRTKMMIYKNGANDTYVGYNFASYIVYYLLIVVMFILNCFADLPPKDTPFIYNERMSPEYSSGFPSRLTFSWFDPIAITGYRRTLTENDCWPLNPQHVSKESVAKFEKCWNRAIKERKSRTIASDISEMSFIIRKQEKEPISILPIICRAFGGLFAAGMALKFCNDMLIFVAPQLLSLLIGFIEGNEPMWRGYVYAVGLFICSTLHTVILGQYFMKTSIAGVKINCALSSMIYKKALSLSNEARKTSTVGEIINLMSTDVNRFSKLTFINLIWSAPLQLTFATYFLWKQLGPSVLAGVAVIIVLMPLNGQNASFQEKLQNKLMRFKDQRIKLMNEVLNGIKVLKIYAWEPSFQEYILQIRNQELKILKQIAYYNSVSVFIWCGTPFLVTLMSFMCFVLVNDTEVLDSKRAFVSLAIFNILRFPMTMLPNVISDAIQICVSVKRLNKFLNSEELDTSMVEHNPNEYDPIVIEDGNFSWGDENAEPILKNLNVRIPTGSLVAIVGTVGSGKTSLLASILGEMHKLSGRVNVKGQTSYVSQLAWIQNATMQDNILFDKPFNKVKYNQVIEACALKTDLAILPGGDQTEIGEKGINLSGGQKARVALARAVYCDADNYLLDDPLSAVDSHVGKHIFEQVIGPNGLLKNKTRVWVTHNISYLAQTDLVLVLRGGEVTECGTYQQLLDEKGAFADFLLHYLRVAEEMASSEDLEDIKQDLETKLGSEFQRKMQWARTSGPRSTRPETNGAGDYDDKHNKTQINEVEVEKDFDQLVAAEKAETGKVKWAVYKYYLSNVGIMASVATIFIYGLLHSLQIGANFWLVRWSNDDNMVVNGTVDAQLRDMYLGVYGGIGLAQAIVTLISDLIPLLACWKAAKVLHEILLNNVLRTPLQFFEVTPIGRILSRFSKDVDSVDTSLARQFMNVLFSGLEVFGTVFVISYSTPMFLTVILPIGAIYYAIQRFYVRTSRQIMRIEAIARSPILSHFNESILGAASIRAFGVKDRFIVQSQKKVDYYQSFVYMRNIADRWLEIRIQIVASLTIFFAALFAVLSRESISPGLAGLSVSYTLEITYTLSWLVQMASSLETNIVAVERMKEYAEVEQEAEWVKSPAPRSSWPETGSVQFEGLTMSYRTGGEPSLRDVTCTVAPRDKLGIVGRTGAGKSTLTLGLFRIVEATGGRVLIDGLDISTLGLHQLRSRITIIPQDPVLFSGSLRMNLDPFDTYTDDDIWRALEHAHLKPFVLGLDAGLLHEVSEGGENLSVGQRQLVCLARALLRMTPLLVLDEATAAVDLHTDELIQKTIRSEFADCTVITIAHRLNTIMDSTKVMVLDKGQLVEYAPPEELLQDKNSMFYNLAKDAGIVS